MKMAEYIDRNTFLAEKRELYCQNCDRRKNSKGKLVYEIGDAPCRACDIGDIMDAIEDYHAADVVERKIGKWITEGDGTVVCSLCDNSAEFNPIDQNFMKMPYCSLCGAMMEG